MALYLDNEPSGFPLVRQPLQVVRKHRQLVFLMKGRRTFQDSRSAAVSEESHQNNEETELPAD